MWVNFDRDVETASKGSSHVNATVTEKDGKT